LEYWLANEKEASQQLADAAIQNSDFALPALELSPTDAQLWYNLGLTQQEEGKFDAAVKTLQHTVEIKPDYVRARVELGDLLVGLGQVEAGKAQYRFILEKLSPNDEETKAKLDALETSAREN
jgi:tetratricopeptide (TPR) repeat protein